MTGLRSLEVRIEKYGKEFSHPFEVLIRVLYDNGGQDSWNEFFETRKEAYEYAVRIIKNGGRP
jgi:hypothetical protein